MCRNGRSIDDKEVSRRLGDRGDLVACLTSQIGAAVEQGKDVPENQVEELNEAVEEIEAVLDSVESAGKIVASEGSRASAD